MITCASIEFAVKFRQRSNISLFTIGLPRNLAAELVLQTMLGSIRFAEVCVKHTAQLRDMVTSPGGTTAEGLLRLEEGGLRAVLVQAVVAAYEKAQSLGKEQK